MRLCKKCGDTSECEHEWIELPDDYVAEADHLEEHGLVASTEMGEYRVQQIRKLLNDSYKYFLQSLALAVEGSYDDATQVFGHAQKRIKILQDWSTRQSANYRVQQTLSWMSDLDTDDDE
jgi:hypothetical protein